MSQQPPILDPQLRQLFIEEAEQRSNEISRGIAEWQNQPNSLDRLVWLQMRFNEYGGMAKTIGLQRSGQHCAEVVDELTQVIAGARDADDSLAALFDDALESIDYALDYLHGEDVAESLIFEADELTEPTVAEKLPTLEFPDLSNPAAAQPQQPGAGQATSAQTEQAQTPSATNQQTQTPPSGVEPSLLEIFFDEAEELLTAADQALNQWLAGNDKADAGLVLKRVFHTLKGNARLTNMAVLGDYLHRTESHIEALVDGPENAALTAQARGAIDRLQQAINELRNGRSATLADVPAASPRDSTIPSTAAVDTSHDDATAVVTARSFVRVKTELLDSLRLRAREMNALRNQIQQVTSSLQAEQKLAADTIEQAVNQLRTARFSLERLIDRLPAALATELTDTQLDSQIALQTLEDSLLSQARQTSRSIELTAHIERALLGQNKAGFSLQEDILNTRLVPFNDYSNRLKRIVRQSCGSLQQDQKAVSAELTVEGDDAELDRQLIERLLPVLEHMLRNAVVHGIETEAQRREAGKPTTGMIRLVVRKTRGKLELDLRDDGRGLDLDTIRQRAITLGLIEADETISQRRLERMIFHPGLSAASQVDQLAGRGIGMDVVEHTVHELGGSIDLNSRPGQGSRFTLRLPIGESALNAIIVTLGTETYAIPQQDIRQILRLDEQAISRGYQANKPTSWNNEAWKVQSLGYWLGLGEGRLPDPGKSLPALLVSADGENHAIVVDQCGESAEYALEALPAPVTGILGVSGAVILEDGQIAPVLDLPALCKANMRYPRNKLSLRKPSNDSRYRVMVVEDSALWRRQIGNCLKRLPLDVSLCEDGEEALQRIDKVAPQLLILDLEMPRLDGLEMLRRLRRIAKYAALPVIMFSTTTGTSQRSRARQLGAKAWVNKSGNMRKLLSEIDRQLATDFAEQVSEQD